MSSLAVGLIVGAFLVALTEISNRIFSYKSYITKEGDTLEKIAKYLYDCKECWIIIYELNKDKLKKNPWKELEAGVQLRYKTYLTHYEKEQLKRDCISWLRKMSVGKVIPE